VSINCASVKGVADSPLTFLSASMTLIVICQSPFGACVIELGETPAPSS
jgi:hypothetical protein